VSLEEQNKVGYNSRMFVGSRGSIHVQPARRRTLTASRFNEIQSLRSLPSAMQENVEDKINITGLDLIDRTAGSGSKHTR
jgi:hypothetical protein